METFTVFLLLMGIQASLAQDCIVEKYGSRCADQYYQCENGVSTLMSCEEGKYYNTLHQDCKEKAGDDLPVDVKVLGRMISLGALYDGRTDRFVPSFSLWSQDTLESQKVVDNRQQEVETDVYTARSIKERISHFDIEASITASFLGGLIEVSGSAGYLTDRVSVDNEVNVELGYHTTKYRETLPAATPKDYPEYCASEQFTHVVTSVLYGLDAYFVFKRITHTEESESQITGSLKIAVTSIPGLVIEGDGSVNITEQEKNTLNTTELKMYGDFSPDSPIPSNFIEAISFYKELPLMAGTEEDGYKGSAPLVAMITPLKLICTDADYILNDIAASIISKITDMKDELDQLRMKADGLLAREPSLRFPALKKNVNLYKRALEEFTLNIDKNLQEMLPNVRGGTGHGEEDLLVLLQEYQTSQFEITRSEEFLLNRGRETEAIQIVLEIFPRDLSNIAVVDYESGNDVDFIFSRDRVLVMEFNSLSLPSNTESFLNGTLVDESDHWYNDILTTAMVGREIRKFLRFALQNLDLPDYGYLIQINPVQEIPLKLTAIVLNQYVIDFVIPDEPTANYVDSPSHSSVKIQVMRPSSSVTGCRFTITNLIDGTSKDVTIEFDNESTKVFEIASLTPMRLYSTSVVFTTELGISPATQLEEPFWTAPSSPPQNIKLTDSRYNELTFSWNAPAVIAEELSLEDLTYDILISGEDGLQFNENTARTSLTLSDLSDATIYNISITAVAGNLTVGNNTGGVSRSLPCISSLTTSPLAPVLETHPGETDLHSAKVYWSVPDRLATGATIEYYVLRYFESNGTGNANDAPTQEVTINDTEMAVNDLAMGQLYNFQVKIVTSLGSSDFSGGFLVKTLYNKTDLDLLREEFGADIDQVQQEFGADIAAVDVRLSKAEMRTAVCGYQNFLSFSSTTTLTFERVYDEVNSGGDLEESGYFTATIEGVYLVTLKTSVRLDSGEWMYGYLKLSSGQYDDNYEDRFIRSEYQAGGGWIYDQASASRYVKMAAGETLHIELKPSGDNGVSVWYTTMCVSLYSASG